jgi:L-histidine N-alpha-methyltransferase
VFLGSTIGNLTPGPRADFLSTLSDTLQPGDSLLLGTDLIKDTGRLVRAYDDSAGVTAQFNRNVLAVINRELGATFQRDTFEHVAIWDATHEWIEMRLRSLGSQVVHIAALDLDVSFEDREEMRTEISAKFRPEPLRRELTRAGLQLHRWWTDGDFALSLSFVAP